METKTLKEQSNSVLKNSKDEFYIIDNYDNHIGKLTYILANKKQATFEDVNKKYIFEKIGFWKNNIQIRNFGDSSVLYNISFNWRNNTSIISLKNGIQVMMRHCDLFGNYWEWVDKTTKEPLIGYTLITDFQNVISIKLFNQEQQNNELNLICALGYFILLKF